MIHLFHYFNNDIKNNLKIISHEINRNYRIHISMCVRAPGIGNVGGNNLLRSLSSDNDLSSMYRIDNCLGDEYFRAKEK